MTIKIYPALTKANEKKQLIPLYMRITNQRLKTEIRLEFSLTFAQAQNWNERLMRVDEKNCRINKYLDSLQSTLDNYMITNPTTLLGLTPVEFKKLLFNMDQGTQLSALKFMDDYYNEEILSSGNITNGTKKNYKKAFAHFKNFLKYKVQEDLLLKNIDVALCLSFKNYLLGEIPGIKQKLKENTAQGLVKKFRTMIDNAEAKKLISGNPFKQIKLSAKTGRKERLNVIQLYKIYHLNLTNTTNLELYREMFLFSCFTGLAYSDLANLKRNDITSYQNNEFKLKIDRQKTKELTESFLVSYAAEIFQKYQSTRHPLSIDSIFPRRSNKTINQMLKIIQERAGVPFQLTSHTARHTFRQLLAEAGIEDDGVIKRMMGQTRRNDIDDVYYSVTDTRLLAAKQRFELYLKENLA